MPSCPLSSSKHHFPQQLDCCPGGVALFSLAVRPKELPKTRDTFGEAATVYHQTTQFSPRIRTERIDLDCIAIGIFGAREVPRLAEGVAIEHEVECRIGSFSH